MSATIEWTVHEDAVCPGEIAIVNGHHVFVSTFDEGPQRPAYYWQIDLKRGFHDEHWFDGWAGAVSRAKRDAAAAAMQMRRGR